MTAATRSAKPARQFWGWGCLRDGLTDGELRAGHQLLAPLGPALAEPQVADYTLAAPRGQLPGSLSSIVSSTPYDRLTHCCGKGFADVARMWMRHAPQAPDWVAFPRTEADITDVLDWASRSNCP